METYGRYQLLRRLAVGGMAEIYLARRTGAPATDEVLVVKRILPHLAENEDFVKMFLDEARIAARLNHPNIVQIFDLGAQDDTFFIAMEYIRGDDVRRLWRQAHQVGVQVPLPLICRIIIEACAGLDYAHKRTDAAGRPLGIVHRDVSPQNLLVSFSGAVKVVDFGIAKAADKATVTRSGVLKGKYSYMSPEQAQGLPVDAGTDIFALGIVLYELLTGARLFKRPSESDTLAAVTACEVDPPSTLNPAIPPELEAIVMKALGRQRADRFADAAAMGTALEAFVVERHLPASTSHLASFMGRVYAARLAAEGPDGLPAPGGEDAAPPDRATPDPRRTVDMRAPSTPDGPRPTEPHETFIDVDEPWEDPVPRPVADATAAARPRSLEKAEAAERRRAEPPPAPRFPPEPEFSGKLVPDEHGPSRAGQQRVLLWVGGVSAAACVVFAVLLATRSAAGRVRVTVTPPGATVTARGRSCVTPCVVDWLAPGRHEVMVSAEGHTPLRSFVDVPRRGTADAAPLRLAAGVRSDSLPTVGSSAWGTVPVTLDSAPPGAVVTINGKSYGTTPLTLNVQQGGTLNFQLDLEGHAPMRMSWVVSRPERRRWTLSPRPETEGGTGTVRFTVRPAATVSCPPHELGPTPLAPQVLPVGTYRCRFTTAGRPVREREVMVERGKTKDVVVDDAAP